MSCGKAGTSHLCDGSAHSSGCVVNGSNAMATLLLQLLVAIDPKCQRDYAPLCYDLSTL